VTIAAFVTDALVISQQPAKGILAMVLDSPDRNFPLKACSQPFFRRPHE
jgi:hypothetical protein